jgi:hypothetical protein
MRRGLATLAQRRRERRNRLIFAAPGDDDRDQDSIRHQADRQEGVSETSPASAYSSRRSRFFVYTDFRVFLERPRWCDGLRTPENGSRSGRSADRTVANEARDVVARSEARTLSLGELRIDEHELGTNRLQSPPSLSEQHRQTLQLSTAGADKVQQCRFGFGSS